MKKDLLKQLKIIVLGSILAFSLSVAYAAWTEPTQNPPNGNVDAPVNVGALSQVKIGGIFADSLGAVKGGYFGGKVGIGTASPIAKLQVESPYSSSPVTTALVGKGSYGFMEIKTNGLMDDGNFPYYSLNRTGKVGWQIGLLGDDFIIARGSGPDNEDLFPGKVFAISSIGGNVGIGVLSPSAGLKLNVGGRVGATEYCDQNGNNCTPAASLGGGGGHGDGSNCPAGQYPTGVDANGNAQGCTADANTLAGLGCSTDHIAKWNGSSWVCSAYAKGSVVGGGTETYLLDDFGERYVCQHSWGDAFCEIISSYSGQIVCPVGSTRERVGAMDNMTGAGGYITVKGQIWYICISN